MSDELLDEVEAINSIYGDGSVVAADEAWTYILSLPGEASSLKLRFPETYPSKPPEVLGTHHSSGGKRGAGARDLALFKEALVSVFQEGAVCLFDAVEDFKTRHEEEEGQQAEEDVSSAANAVEQEEPAYAPSSDPVGGGDASLPEPPPWTVSEVVTDTKSTFVAHVAPVTSPEQARRYVQHLLSSDRRIRSATHNMTAWRIRAAGGVSYQDCDDDGEAAAGGRLLHLMQLMGVWDAMVVVTRWYGGVHLGPRRFAVINAVARNGFVRAGMVPDKGGGDAGKKKGR
ncbi:ribosomal protein S5 domain 2-type protein [Stachybotrys elegans]|uniref:Ribosomal protein S5 domain 2-type protein n=1 Tax=Stachybotrys elegans TaxID=80388 RepID=A0A8K0SRS2_9HYPO|nr:ribosomal protein S5 domain 2-type protein [Stachybotrys elegans]